MIFFSWLFTKKFARFQSFVITSENTHFPFWKHANPWPFDFDGQCHILFLIRELFNPSHQLVYRQRNNTKHQMGHNLGMSPDSHHVAIKLVFEPTIDTFNCAAFIVPLGFCQLITGYPTPLKLFFYFCLAGRRSWVFIYQGHVAKGLTMLLDLRCIIGSIH